MFMLGLTSGVVSIRYRNGDEKVKIERSGAVWGVQFFRTKDNFDLVALADWSKTLSFYDLNGKVVRLVDCLFIFSRVYLLFVVDIQRADHWLRSSLH